MVSFRFVLVTILFHLSAAWSPGTVRLPPVESSKKLCSEKAEEYVDRNTLLRHENFSVLLSRGVNVPLFQRDRNDDRVEEFLKNIVENYFTKGFSEVPFLNAMSLATSSTNQTYLLDGQHRFEAYKSFYATYKKDFPVFYFIRSCNTKDELRAYFRQLNSNYKMDDIIIDQLFMERRELLVEYLRKNYKEHISNKPGARYPNINLDIFIPIFLRMYPEEPIDSLINKLEEHKQEIGENLQRNDRKKYDEAKSGKKQGFFLAHAFKPSTKTAVPKVLRDRVWESKIGDKSKLGYCYCCKMPLQFSEYHAGHKIARINGGTDDISNREVVCQCCNLSMGTKDMDTFCQNHFGSLKRDIN